MSASEFASSSGRMTRRLRVDMHTHTEFSRDSRLKLDVFARAAARAGLDVVCVTDHDTIDGALRLRDMDVPFRVIVGEEVSTREGEVIGLFLKQPVPPRLGALETMARIHDQGGLVYVPHPFSRNRTHRVGRKTLLRIVGQVDAIEVFNAREAFAGDNRKALAFARAHDLPGGVGSDSHRAGELGGAYLEIAPFESSVEFLAALREGEVAGQLAGIRAHVRTRYDVFRRWLARKTKRD